MGLIQRLNETVAANVNAMISKSEDPAKIVDYQYSKLERETAEMKSKTAAVMAEETAIKEQLEKLTAEREKVAKCVEKAVIAGNDDDAKILLEKQNKLDKKIESLEATYVKAQENSKKMKALYSDMSDKLDELEITKEEIKSKVAVAKAQSALSAMNGKNGGSETMATFNRMKKKANDMVRQASALNEIDETVDGKSAESLEKKYSQGMDIEEQLAAIKAKVTENLAESP